MSDRVVNKSVSKACSMGKIGLYDFPKIVVSRILDAL